jgi:HemY protein
MARIIRFLLVLLVLSFIAAWLAEHPGRLTLNWEDYRVETSVAVLVVAVAAISAGVALLYRLWLAMGSVPGRLRRRSVDRRRARGYKALSLGMVAVAAGDAAEAERHARQADVLLGDPALTLLLSAQAAQLRGDEGAAERFFKAMVERPEMSFLGLRGLINQALKRGNKAEALALARRARLLRPDSAWVGNNLFALETDMGRWDDAAATLREEVRHRAVDKIHGDQLAGALAHLQSLDAEARGDTADALRQAERANKLSPGLVPAAAHLARLLAAMGKDRKARATVEKAWSLSPHPDLVEAYLAIGPAKAVLARVTAVEKLAQRRPDHEESRIAVASAALDAELWGEARSRLRPLSDGDPSARVCRLMARLEESEHKDMAGAHSWLSRASVAPPDPAWICSECAMAARSWTARCPHCGAFASQRWQMPPALAPLAAAGPNSLRLGSPGELRP